MTYRFSDIARRRRNLLRVGWLVNGLATAALEAAPEETKLRLFTPAWRDIGGQDPKEVAKKFTIIFGHLDPTSFHRGNPDSFSFKYVLGPYVDKAEMETLPRAALASDKLGGVVKARDWANWLVVPDSLEWLSYLKTRVPAAVHGGYDGIFVDSMGTAPVEENYTNTVAINPRTGNPYSKTEWLTAEKIMLRTVRSALPAGKRLTLNGLGPGPRYWAEPESESPRVLLSEVDGAMSERIWRDPKNKLDAWPSTERWLQDVHMIQDVEKRGLMGFWWTKCWTNGDTSRHEPNADVLVPQWLRFALASYLVAAGPHSYFNFDTDRHDQPISNAAENFPEYEIELGQATSEMLPIGKSGGYFRRFSKGLVMVNPTPAAVAADAMEWKKIGPAKFRAAGENGDYDAPFALPAHTGLLLTYR